MGSDRARITYDPRQQYRSVVMQQGRVTLEADWNEAQQIAGEELRRETLDIVGPAGTPDDGYGVVIPSPSAALPFDFFVEKGTMYVGGERVWLDQQVRYSSQSDWLDAGSEDPDWVDLATLAAAPPANEFVYLFLREQEVSAVEDPDLKDVALGGPDTAQRTRLLQRMVRVASQGSDCASGLAAAEAHWQAEGLVFDPATMRLISDSSLSVSAAAQQPAPNPCLPQAQGGYVDPDNQLIRVQISGVDALTGNPMFLWGFDDASFLYRIDVDPNNAQNLLLQSAPVDSYHQPVRGQAVEVLRTAAELSNGGSVAALSGFPFTLDQNYDPDAQSIVMPSGVSLPADYLTAAQSPPIPLFLRVWQEEKVFTPGVATVLGDTGLQVTLETANGDAFHIGDYWAFAVRPATPQTVYPERYWNNFQPPEGPRLWACPLAVLAWGKQGGYVASDCRNSFCSLSSLCSQQGGCCTIAVDPRDLNSSRTLQSVLDSSSNLAMRIAAVDTGLIGDNISVEVLNLRSDLSPATFDFTVTESETYSALTVSGILSVLGDERSNSTTLAHQITASINQDPNAVPAAQSVFFSDAQTPSARGDFYNSAGSIVFTLEAKRPGDDGNLTTATVANINAAVTPNTFDLTLTWTKTLAGLTAGSLVQSIQSGMAYEISVTAPAGRTPSTPVERVTFLSGGADITDNAAAIAATANLYGYPVKLCLSPGVYQLQQPLQITDTLSNLTIEACNGATLEASPGADAQFDQGMITITSTSGITLRGLVFKMPRLQVLGLYANTAGYDGNFARGRDAMPSGATASIAIRPVDCQHLTIEDCTFNYPQTQALPQICGGILAAGECIGLQILRNRFNGPSNFLSNFPTNVIADLLVYGYAQVPTTSSSATLGTENEAVSNSVLDHAHFQGNTFQSLLSPVLVLAALGQISFDSNTITACPSGISLVEFAQFEGAQLPDGAAALKIPALVTSGISQEFSQAALTQKLAAAVSYPLPSSYRAASMVATASASQAPDFVPQSLILSMRITNNNFNTILSAAIGGGETVMLIANAKNINGSLIMCGNRFINQSSGSPTVFIEGVNQCVITGNLILNEQPYQAVYGSAGVPPPPSLQVTAIVAVTGNILRGQPTIPQRAATLPYGAGILPAPMDHWEAYNTEL